MEDAFPIVRHPAPDRRTPILVSVPHYGTQPLPGIERDDYSEPWFETFAYGFADTFARDLYADLHGQRASGEGTSGEQRHAARGDVRARAGGDRGRDLHRPRLRGARQRQRLYARQHRGHLRPAPGPARPRAPAGDQRVALDDDEPRG